MRHHRSGNIRSSSSGCIHYRKTESSNIIFRWIVLHILINQCKIVTTYNHCTPVSRALIKIPLASSDPNFSFNCVSFWIFSGTYYRFQAMAFWWQKCFIRCLTHCPPERCNSNSLHTIKAWSLATELLSDKWSRTLLMRNQNWFMS